MVQVDHWSRSQNPPACAMQVTFMTGKLRVGGDLRVLLDHGDALAQLGDVFSSVRAVTEVG